MTDLAGLSLNPEEREILKHPATGGIILFARNYANKSQLRSLIGDIRQCRPAILVAVDQEGGRIQRFTQGMTRLPAMHAVGECFDQNAAKGLTLAHDCGQLMASELVDLGVDISFAPVLDIYRVDNSVVGDRAFHHDPQVITQLAEAYISGMNAAGMQATGKHFPGHGGVAEDSHNLMPIDYRDLKVLQRADLIPFYRLAQKLGGIMTAHICFAQINADLPSYSSFWLKQILRQEMAFTGFIFSDDLSMVGAATVSSPADRAQAAQAAGCDMVLVCNDRSATYEILNAVSAPDAMTCDRLKKMYANRDQSATVKTNGN